MAQSVYIVLQPDSTTNPTSQWVVAEFADWATALETGRDFSKQSFDTYAEAKECADTMNAAVSQANPMDPNATLIELRELSLAVLHDTSNLAAYRMAELFQALDEWMLNGSFSPQEWARPILHSAALDPRRVVDIGLDVV